MRGALGVALLLAGVMPVSGMAQPLPPGLPPEAEPLLFRVIGPRDDVTVGLTAAEFAAIGSALGVERLARKLSVDGQLTAWRYAVGRAPDGTTQFVAAGRVAILRHDALRIESYLPALPVASPPPVQ